MGERWKLPRLWRKKPKSEYDRMPKRLRVPVSRFNAEYALLSDAGMQLLRQRDRTVELLEVTTHLINSVANTEKRFDSEIEEIQISRSAHNDIETSIRHSLDQQRRSALAGGAGAMAGTATAAIAPTAAMWVATTFGTASTGTAISALSGAAATKAALAWLGGGTLVAGGKGMVGGALLLGLAGPIGWGIAGASLLAFIILFTKSRFTIKKNVASVQVNTVVVSDTRFEVNKLVAKSVGLRERLSESYLDCLRYFESDYSSLDESDKQRLATLVNVASSCARELTQTVETRG